MLKSLIYMLLLINVNSWGVLYQNKFGCVPTQIGQVIMGGPTTIKNDIIFKATDISGNILNSYDANQEIIFNLNSATVTNYGIMMDVSHGALSLNAINDNLGHGFACNNMRLYNHAVSNIWSYKWKTGDINMSNVKITFVFGPSFSPVFISTFTLPINKNPTQQPIATANQQITTTIVQPTCQPSTTYLPPPTNYVDGKYNYIKYNTLTFGWYINNNQISIIAYIKVNSCNSWFSIAFSKNNNKMTGSDAIFGWGNNLCALNIDGFTLPPESKVDGKSIFLYKKPIIYFIDKSVTYDNDLGITLKFTRLINTGDNNDIQITNNTNILYAVGGEMSNNYVSIHDYYYSFNINFETNTAIQVENKVDNLKDYYLPIITGSIFSVFILIGLILTHIPLKIKFFDKNFNLYYLGYTSGGTIIFMICYLIWWISVLVYSFLCDDNDEIMTRLGFWISLNLSIILLPISRNNLSVIIFNLSQEKIIHIHRMLSVLCIFSVFIKFISVLILYKPSLLIETEYGDVNPLFGTISTFLFFIIGSFSVPLVREKYFELFYYTHRFISALIMIIVSFHTPIIFYYNLPSLSLYVSELLIRYFKTYKIIFSKLQTFGDDHVLLHLTTLKNINVYPGCYFYLNHEKSNEWHPLSLVSYKKDNLIFCFKNVGKNTWTGSLYDYVKKCDIISDKNFTIQGPYGYRFINYYKYSCITFFAGGIGITPLISFIEKIHNNFKKIKFIWLINNISLIKIFKPMILNFNRDTVEIHIYMTKDTKEIDIDLEFYNIGRPNISNLLLTSLVGDYNENAIFCCGPESLVNDIKSFSTVNNIDLYCESFSK